MSQQTPSQNESRFLEQFLESESHLRVYARALLPNWDAVDDVLQEASSVMWKKFGCLETKDGFLPWAKVIVRFECLKARRKYARDRLIFNEDLLNLLANTADELDSEQHHRKIHSTRNAMSSCLSKLSQEHRELVLAPYQSDTTIRALAQKSNIRPTILYKLVSRLRIKVKSCIERELLKETS